MFKISQQGRWRFPFFSEVKKQIGIVDSPQHSTEENVCQKNESGRTEKFLERFLQRFALVLVDSDVDFEEKNEQRNEEESVESVKRVAVIGPSWKKLSSV